MDIPKKIDNTTKEDDTVNIYFLDVGIGDCIIIENNKKFGMIDTGYKYTSKSVYKFMKKLKIKELEFLIITHNHADHVGGFDIINKKFKIKKLYIKKARLKASEKTGMKAYNSIIKKATKSKTKVKDVAASGKGSFKMGNIKLKFYSRKKFKIYDDAVHGDNVNSIGTLATINGIRVYFPGDLGNYFGAKDESNVAKSVGKVDIYKAYIMDT